MYQMADRLYAAARRIRSPTLLVRGAQSDVVSDESVQEFLAAVPGASFVDIAGAGHMVAGDHNDAFSIAVDRLPRRARRRQPGGAGLDRRPPERRDGAALAGPCDGGPRRVGGTCSSISPNTLPDGGRRRWRRPPRRDHLAELLRRASTERPPRLHGPVTFSRSSPVGRHREPVRRRHHRIEWSTTSSSARRSSAPGSRVHPDVPTAGSCQGLIDETMAALLVARQHPRVHRGARAALHGGRATARAARVPGRDRPRTRASRYCCGCIGSHEGHVFVEATGRFRLIDLRHFASDLDERAITGAPNDG